MVVVGGQGSLCIIVDVLHDSLRRKRVYNRIVFLMSCADVVSSMAMAFSTLPVTRSSGVYGGIGNRASCKIQGFFIQIALTSQMYNLMLSIYFYLALKLNWKESRIRRYQYVFFGLPLAVGITLATWGIHQYGSVSTWCHVDVPPVKDSWLPILLLVLIPNFCVSIIATVMMVSVYLKVRRQSRRMARWSFSGSKPETLSGSSNGRQRFKRRENGNDQVLAKLDRQLFTQAVLYLSAFYVTHVLEAYLAFHYWSEPYLRTQPADIYAVWVLFLILKPLQGFWNAFIYFRPRIIRRQQRRQQRNLIHQANNNNDGVQDVSESGGLVHDSELSFSLHSMEEDVMTKRSSGDDHSDWKDDDVFPSRQKR